MVVTHSPLTDTLEETQDSVLKWTKGQKFQIIQRYQVVAQTFQWARIKVVRTCTHKVPKEMLTPGWQPAYYFEIFNILPTSRIRGDNDIDQAEQRAEILEKDPQLLEMS